MIVVILVGVATAALVGWLMVVLARFATEVRVPRAAALGRLGPSAYRVIRAAPARLHGRPESREQRAERQPPREDAELDPQTVEPDPEDVELAVRERLYGARSGSR
jgi:hypothetical protein